MTLKGLEKNNDEFLSTLIISSLKWASISGLLIVALGNMKDASRLNHFPMPPIGIFYIIAGILIIISIELIVHKNWCLAILPSEYVITMYYIITLIY